MNVRFLLRVNGIKRMKSCLEERNSQLPIDRANIEQPNHKLLAYQFKLNVCCNFHKNNQSLTVLLSVLLQQLRTIKLSNFNLAKVLPKLFQLTSASPWRSSAERATTSA